MELLEILPAPVAPRAGELERERATAATQCLTGVIVESISRLSQGPSGEQLAASQKENGYQ